MSQNVDIGPNCIFMSKNGKILYHFIINFIKNLRHRSLQMNVSYGYVKFHHWKIINKVDILVQKIKVKKSIFRFLAPSFHC